MRAIVKFVVVELVAAAVIVALISMVYIFVLQDTSMIDGRTPY